MERWIRRDSEGETGSESGTEKRREEKETKVFRVGERGERAG